MYAAGSRARTRCVGMLSPLDIHNQEFRRVMRGYSEDEVDNFLDRVVADFETLQKENAELRGEVEELRARVEQYKQLENTLHNALIVAQDAAEEVRQNARKEAQLIVREAEEEGARTIKAGELRVREAEEQLARLFRESQAFRARWRSQLEAQLELLRSDPLQPPTSRSDGATGASGSASPGDTTLIP